MFGRGSKGGAVKKSEDVKKSAGKVLDTKKDTPTRAKVSIFLLAVMFLFGWYSNFDSDAGLRLAWLISTDSKQQI